MRLVLKTGILFYLYCMASFPANAQINDCQSEGNRVIVLGGSLTELVYALGAEKRLVAVDVTSTYPDATESLPKVGYYRRVGAEGLLSMGPDLILAEPDAGPPEVLEQIAAVGVCIKRVPEGGSSEAVFERAQSVADALNLNEKGEELKAGLKAKFAAANDYVNEKEASSSAPRVLFLLSANGGTPVAAGEDTDADAIIKLAGGVNAVSGFTGFKPLSSEIAASSAPDAILMMEHVVSQTGADEILSLPQLQLTPAGKNGKLIAMDGLLLLGFGPRTPEAIMSLAEQIHVNP